MKFLRVSCSIIILTFIFSSCAEMNAALSNATANTCIYTACVSSAFNYRTGEYVEGTYILTTRDGVDVSYREGIWVDNRQSYYNSLPNFGVWYERSPYSKEDYRFSTYCSQHSNSYYGW